MSSSLTRREALRHLLVLSSAAALPGVLAACGKKAPSCTDTSGLSPDELTMRTQTAAYVETAPNPAQRCDGCAQWNAPASPDACGGCKVVKGPINPAGWCKLWVQKPA